MNDDEKMSSSNTTPFNNIGNHNKVLNNDKLAKYTGNRQIRPRNTNLNNERIDGDINNIPPIQDKKDSPNNNQQPVKENNKTKSRRNPFGPKNRLNNTASNLRDKLDTNPDMKDEVAKKGAEALKKSANPYAKAAGYAASFLQNRKNKKKKEEEKEDDNKQDEDKNDDNNDNNEESSQGLVDKKTRTRLIIHLTLMILPYVLVFILILSAIMPLLNAYSWVQSLFHHKSEHPESYYVHDKNQTEQLEREIKFNDAIVGSSDGSKKGIIEEYKEKYSVTLDKSLLISLLIYRNVASAQEDYDDLTEDEINDNLESSSEEKNKEMFNQLKKYFEKELGRGLFLFEESSLLTKVELINLHGADKNLIIGAFNLARKNSLDGFDEVYFNTTIDFWLLKEYKTYQEAYIDFAADSMLCRNDDSVTTDIKVGGCVYNNLITNGTDANNFIKIYYSDILKDTEPETVKRLVDEIFDYAEGARLMDDEEEEKPVNGGVIGDTSIVHLQTCKLDYTLKDVNGLKVYDNPPWNEGTEYPDYLNMKEYIKGVVKSEIGVSSDYKEAMKAQAIAALTFIINDSRSGFDLKNGEMYFPSGTCRQAACSPTNGCTSYPEPTAGNPNITTHVVGLNRKSGGRNHDPISEADNEILEEVLNDVFGKVMVKKGVTSATYSGSKDTSTAQYLDRCSAGKCFSQQDAMVDARSGMNYEQILAKYYSGIEYDIINIVDGLYYESSGDNFNGTIKLNESFHYHQGDSPWGSQNLCDSGSISGNGCNITSAAIVISLLKNDRITPETLNNRQSENPYCKQSSRPQMIQQFGKMYGLNVQIVNKGNTMAIHDMVLKIASGKYAAVARIAPNSGRYSTGSGHYVAIVGARSSNGTDQILVWDPATKSSSRDNAWVDVNYLIKYLQPEYSFILMGS